MTKKICNSKSQNIVIILTLLFGVSTTINKRFKHPRPSTLAYGYCIRLMI